MRKKFASHAILTGIELPVERCIIEGRVHDVVAELIESPIRLPAIVRQLTTSTETVFEFVSGLPLRQLSQAQWPHDDVFRCLGNFLARVEKIADIKLNAIFFGLEKTENRAREAIILYKIGTEHIDLGESCLCLGDVGLNNLLWDGSNLYIIDFEFAHREGHGFDMGQLCAELEAREIALGLPKQFRDALVQGYQSNGGHCEAMTAWQLRFRNYYGEKYGRRGVK